jgi:hypothetical protein
MKRLASRFALAALALGLASCAVPDSGPRGPQEVYVPRVSMPVDLSPSELALVPELAATLEQNGFRPSNNPQEEYGLDFSVEDGPVNADVTITLYRGRGQVARGYARVGGARILFQRQQVIRESFNRAVDQFVARLPRGM